jgi:hypothetical protein
MDDLNASTFFDGRTIQFLSNLLRNPNTSCLSAVEKDFLERRDELVALNEKLEYQLVSKLTRYKNFIPVIDATNFLLLGQQQDILASTDSILESAVREERVLKAKELAESLGELENMPVGWIVNLLGVSGESRHSQVEITQPVSSLNLEAMRNFK